MVLRLFALSVCLGMVPGWSQYQVEERHRHERLIAVVPMIGSGTYEDPKRPLLTPASVKADDGILAYSYELSDDGKSAIVEIVARDRKALQPILNAGRADVKAFLKGRDKLEDVEREVRKVKKDFAVEKMPGAGVRGGPNERP
ncbi:MAG: hypothetical protein R2762_29655, partial [Bryobacteraceae bacterium]